MVMRELFVACCARLREAGISDAATDVRVLVDFVMGQGALFAARFPQYEPTPEQYSRLTELVSRRAAHVPVAYLVGEKEFMGLPFLVDPDVLIPRGDTECLVEAALDYLKHCQTGKPVRILDIGTGSGAIAVSVAKYCTNAQVTGIDLSEAALRIAGRNAEKNRVEDRCRFLQCDILHRIPEGEYDLVLSNPPYIPPDVLAGLEPDVRDYEPRTALTDGHDGLDFYRRISRMAPGLLPGGGALYLEIGCEQKKDVTGILQKDGWDGIAVQCDLAGRPRVVSGVWNKR